MREREDVPEEPADAGFIPSHESTFHFGNKI